MFTPDVLGYSVRTYIHAALHNVESGCTDELRTLAPQYTVHVRTAEKSREVEREGSLGAQPLVGEK